MVEHRRSRPVTTSIKCQDNNLELGECRVKGSVRSKYAALCIEGGEWAHMTLGQAKLLASWLERAIEEIEARKQAYPWL